MSTLPTRFAQLTLAFALLFSKPAFKAAQVLPFGAILAVGKRTATSVLCVMGLEAIARTTPCLLLGLYSILTLLAQSLFVTGQLSIRGAAWYPKPQATFSDTIASRAHGYGATNIFQLRCTSPI